MKRSASTAVVVLTLAVLAAGCRPRKGDAAGELEKQFHLSPTAGSVSNRPVRANGPADQAAGEVGEKAWVQRLAGQTVAAIHERNYTCAVTNLQTLQAQRQLTPDQRVAVQHAIESVQVNLALEVNRGTAGAQRKAEQLREAVRH